jgi:enterochelin esterase-like enzyme
MKRMIIVLLACGALATLRAQTFQDFITRVNIAPESLRTSIVDSFMNAAGHFPFVEFDTLCHTIYRGAANSVTVAGDANNWSPSANSLIHIYATDFWYYSAYFESDARLDYKFVLNGSNWILDPRNPYTCSGGFGPNSELRMPAYVPAPEIVYDPSIPHGALHDTTFFSTNLNNSRRIRVYTPPNYNSETQRYGVILFHDGLEYISLAQTNNVLDYLIGHHRIRPVIAVFVPPVNRTPEYAGDQQNQFTAFIMNEVMPWVDASYRTVSDPAQRAVLGASYGGNISLWIGMNYPGVFGCIAPQSSYIQPNIQTRFQNDPPLSVRLYLDLGTYDIPELIPMVHQFVTTLQQHGYDYRFIEYPEGHSWGNWRAHIDNALLMFFPGDSANTVLETTTLPAQFELAQNFPNPFNAATTISFSLPSSQKVSLRIFNVEGRHIATLLDSQATAGDHAVRFDAAHLGSGLYFYQLRTDRAMQTKKMLLMK